MTPKYLLPIFCAALLAYAPAEAQVFKCSVDGRIAYRDTPCPTSTTKAEVIKATPNTLDMREAREQDQRVRERQEIEAQERMQQNMLIQQQQLAYRQAQQAQAQAQANQRAQEEFQKEWQKFEERNYKGRKRYGTPPPPPPPPPAQIVNCDPAGCWDTNGNRLNNAAGGNFFRSDGRFCTNTGGGNYSCN